MARIDEVRAGEATWGEWWLDQLGHAGLGAIYSSVGTALGLFVIGWGPWASLGLGLSFALFGGVVREIVQLAKSGKLHFEDRLYDALFHLPGAIVPAVALIVRALL
jgi:hypothetical protein